MSAPVRRRKPDVHERSFARVMRLNMDALLAEGFTADEAMRLLVASISRYPVEVPR